MARSRSLGSRIVAQDLLIQGLMQNAAIVGGIYTMGYHECVILTNDLWKAQAGGVPQHCFLLATAMTPGQAPNVEDEEVILLRVIGPATLPAEAELVQVRAEAMRELVIDHGREEASSPSAIVDVLTRNEIQFSAIKAKILGTFYDSDEAGRSLLAFGSDVETFHSASHYKVYKPYADSLAIIGSFPEVTIQEQQAWQDGDPPPRRVRIGTVRYSSTNRRRRRNLGSDQDIAVPVAVNVDDFIALKTAVFGMTRLGKSNTMKTIATAVCQHAAETGQSIGQLLFDPAGEYANVNVQDQTALSQIGDQFVTIFRYGAAAGEAGVRPLSTNFFSDDTIEVTWSILASHLRARQADYLNSFLSADVIGPERQEDDRSAFNRARRRRAALYATLLKADFRPHNNLSVRFVANRDVVDAVNEQLDIRNQDRDDDEQVPQFRAQRGNLRLNANNLREFWDCLIAARDAGADLGNWIDAGLDAILTVYQGSVGSGYRVLQPLRVFHSPNLTTDYAQEVLNELIQGRIVIIDLSLGTESVLQFCSERIINHIVNDAARRFAAGQDPHRIQIFIEEAHRLFNRDRMKSPEEADPYVRLAKEAAKYRIGLIYATQEVSSVDPIILSNTSNWIVTHLNNHAEACEFPLDERRAGNGGLDQRECGHIAVKIDRRRAAADGDAVEVSDQVHLSACQAEADGNAGGRGSVLVSDVRFEQTIRDRRGECGGELQAQRHVLLSLADRNDDRVLPLILAHVGRDGGNATLSA